MLSGCIFRAVQVPEEVPPQLRDKYEVYAKLAWSAK